MSTTPEPDVLHKGGCHCGAIRFEVSAPPHLHVYKCNCSVCFMKANDHFVIPKSKLRLLCGEDCLTTYTFNTKKAQHTFCKICGVQSFYTPRSNPDGYGVNPRCLDKGTVVGHTVEGFDGQNWEASFATSDISKRSKE